MLKANLNARESFSCVIFEFLKFFQAFFHVAIMRRSAPFVNRPFSFKPGLPFLELFQKREINGCLFHP